MAKLKKCLYCGNKVDIHESMLTPMICPNCGEKLNGWRAALRKLRRVLLTAAVWFASVIVTAAIGNTVFNTSTWPEFMSYIVLIVPIVIAIIAFIRFPYQLKQTPLYPIGMQEHATVIQNDSIPDRITVKEAELNIKEDQLAQKESAVDKKLKELQLKIDEYKSINVEEIKSQQQTLDDKLKALQQYEKVLYATEHAVRDWVKRREKEESQIFDEMLADVEKFKQYSAMNSNMDGFKFEQHIADILRDNGYTNVTVTPKSQDYGADIVADYGIAKYVFQCKYYSSTVGLDAVQQIFAAKTHYDADIAVVVTNSIFSTAAKKFAAESNVKLWDCKTLIEMTGKKGVAQ